MSGLASQRLAVVTLREENPTAKLDWLTSAGIRVASGIILIILLICAGFLFWIHLLSALTRVQGRERQ